jgi:hypothetical protein
MLPFKSAKWIPAVFVSLLLFPLGLLLNRQFLQHVNTPSLFLTTGAVKGGLLKVYWNLGDGFHESKSKTISLGHYDEQVLRYPLQTGIQNLRVDPEGVQYPIEIRDARIGYFRWPGATLLPMDLWIPTHEVTLTRQPAGNGMRWSFPEGATDPHLGLLLGADDFRRLADQRSNLLLSLDLALLLFILLSAGAAIILQRPK